MNTPLITAIIPTYKRPQLLKRAVRSALRQTYKHFIILIADNASGPETTAVIEELMREDPRVTFMRHATNIGAVANFQAALMATKTPYVCFLPDDDFFSPFFFEETLQPFDCHHDLAFCGGGGALFYQDYSTRPVPAPPPSGYYPPPEGLFAYLRSSFALAFSSILFKTDVLKAFGGFDTRIRNGADEYLISHCAARHSVYLLTGRPFCFGFQHAGSISKQIDFVLFEREACQMHEALQKLPFAAHEMEEINAFFHKRRKKILSTAYDHFYRSSAFESARSYAGDLFKHTGHPLWRRKARFARLCSHAPFFATLYQLWKLVERGVRSLKKKRCQVGMAHTPDFSWKEYALSLEKA